MKIGIITFHNAINYGAALQAYALQNAIKKLGYEVDIIDYNCKRINNAYSFVNKLKQSKSVKYSIYLFVKRLLPNVKKNTNVKNFINHYLKLSDYCDINNIKSFEEKYDLFITGSDQVWNYGHTDFDKTYFLDFVTDSHKKKSYAASFGFEVLPEKYIDEYRKLLGEYDIISVREKSAVPIISELLPEKDIVVSADPSLLLDKDEWKELTKDIKNKYGDYVLVYELMPSESLREYARKIARGKNYSVICLSDKIMNIPGVKCLYGVSPRMFLSLIQNAKAVCTNSFHGTAFSVNFNTPVCIELLKDEMAVLNSRITDLIDMFDIKDRIISEKIDPFNMKWDFVNKKKKEIAKDGLQYLKKICGDI